MSYKGFASVYDVMMQDVPYEQWVYYIKEILKKFGSDPKMILDLGCGTGTITVLLAQMGYDMIGLDLSEEMLAKAREKSEAAQVDVLYLCQDMCQFELYGTVECVVSLCDSLNYIVEEGQLLEVFKGVHNYLEPNGLFIFDLNTEYKFETLLADQTFAQTYEDCAFIWDNYYDETEKLNEYQLTLFIQKNKQYERYEELHYEKAYTIEAIESMLKEAGLHLEAVYDDNTFKKPKKTSERLYFVVRRTV